MEPSLGRRALQPLEKFHTPGENVSEGKPVHAPVSCSREAGDFLWERKQEMGPGPCCSWLSRHGLLTHCPGVALASGLPHLILWGTLIPAPPHPCGKPLQLKDPGMGEWDVLPEDPGLKPTGRGPPSLLRLPWEGLHFCCGDCPPSTTCLRGFLGYNGTWEGELKAKVVDLWPLGLHWASGGDLASRESAQLLT